jgi:hypothetical protein
MRKHKISAVFRSLAFLVGLAWLVGSAARGGLRSAALSAWRGTIGRGAASPGQPDARTQWSGPYYDVIGALAREPLTRETTVAVVLSERDRPSSGAPTRMYEAIYRLYPAKVDPYFPAAPGKYRSFWPGIPTRLAPRLAPPIPSLWRHDYVLWADPEAAGAPRSYELLGQSSEASLYRKRGS